MSTSTPPSHDNPKAAAKAAKAYAKAARPWYKKKRFIIPIGFVMLVVLITALSGGETDGNATTNGDSASSEASSSEIGSQDSPAPVGTPVENASAKYTINSVEVRDSLGDLASPPAGKFVVVTLSVENVKTETIQMSSEDFVLQVDGTEIEAWTEGWMLDDAISYEDISPGLAKQGSIVFDVAPELAGQGVLKAQALFSMDDAVYLALQ